MTSRLVLCFALSMFTGLRGLAQEVSVAPAGDDWTVQAPTYRATVAGDGSLTSLRVGGQEFFHAAPGNPRGAYHYQKGPLKLSPLKPGKGAVLTGQSDRLEVRYAFEPATVRWTVSNRTREKLLCLIVFDLSVQAVCNEQGLFEKTPIACPWDTTTWFAGEAKLKVTGGSRLWGPWAAGYQVWEATLNPEEKREIVMEVGTSTPAEREQVEAAREYASQPPTDPTGPMWDLTRLSAPPETYPAEGFEEEGVRALFYEGLPFRGRPTRVFAWLGLPPVKAGERVPGMVLVHGGGGTAFADWVRLWTSRGYAALAMDTCGCLPTGGHGNRPRHPAGGPPGWGGWQQIDWPREDQWTYHAVADVVLAHSLLRSLPEVDAERIGLTGISWGGYLTCIVAGVDPRFKFAAPVYGCGFLAEHGQAKSLVHFDDQQRDRWLRWWDASVYLPKAKMPLLWVAGSNDFAYTLNALQKSYRLPPGPRTLCVRLRMPHGQGPGAAPEEIHAFADHLLRGGPALPKITDQGRDGDQVWAAYQGDAPPDKAELNVTNDVGRWQDRNWRALPAAWDPTTQRATATLPKDTAVYYFNFTDEEGRVVSSEHVELLGD